MKALLINGSPRKDGCTYTALSFVAEELDTNGIETEIFQIPAEPISGCIACRACAQLQNKCAINDDVVNVIIEKMIESDALVIGSPVYFASPAGQLLTVLDRVFFADGGEVFANKPGAVVCSARRAGTTATLDAMMKYFCISGMPTVPSSYWPMVHGVKAEDVLSDKEGVQSMRALGANMAWLLKTIRGKTDVQPPQKKDKVFMNFIR